MRHEGDWQARINEALGAFVVGFGLTLVLGLVYLNAHP